MDVGLQLGEIDVLIAELAERQHGRVARRQLLEMGIGRGAIDWRQRHGRLRAVAPGVYAVGHRIESRKAKWMEAVLEGGSGAVLSHRAGAAHWRLRQSTGVEITTPRALRPRRGVTRHKRLLPPDETTVLDGIPVTTVPRTIFDLAAVLPARDVERAIHEADHLRLADHLSLSDLLERHPGRRGAVTIKAILAHTSDAISREALVQLFLDVIAIAGLPRPERNVFIDGFEVDCVWRGQRLMVELDGWTTHGTRRAYERDRVRDRHFTRNGWRVIRITWRALQDEPEAVAADVAALLGY